MLIMAAESPVPLSTLDLTVSAFALLHHLFDVQAAGGAIPLSQRDLAAALQTTPSVVSKAMGKLEQNHLVLRRGSGRRYWLHPLIAGYASEGDLQEGLAVARERIERGELPAIRGAADHRAATSGSFPLPSKAPHSVGGR